jgi:hypothetical protein
MSNPYSNNGNLIGLIGDGQTFGSISQTLLGSPNYIPFEDGLIVVHAYGDPNKERPVKAKAVLWLTDVDPVNATAEDIILMK